MSCEEIPLEIGGSSHSIKLLDDLTTSLEQSFHEVHQHQKQHAFGSDEQIPPNRLPLKRRLAEFHHHQPLNTEADTLMTASSAIEKFRDITPAFVVAVFEETLVFEPGDIRPISMGHPVAQDLISAINKQELSPALMAVLRESGAPFYDGCLVVGLVDYRKQAFGVLGTGPHVPIRKEATASQMPYRNPIIAPEMHKIILRPTGASIMADINELMESFPKATDDLALEIESQIVLATHPAVCLSPDPFASEALTAFNYDRRKMNEYLEPFSVPPKTVSGLGKDIGRAPLRSAGPKLKFSDVLEGERANRRSADAEPYYGLDVKKDPGRFKDIPPNTPLFAWVQPNQRLWRTMRFESPAPQPVATHQPKKRHYTIHILLNTAGHFDVIFRRGSAAFTATDGETLRFRLPNRSAAEAYVEKLQFIMAVDGNLCVGDVSNPTVFNTAMPGAMSGARMSMGAAGQYAASQRGGPGVIPLRAGSVGKTVPPASVIPPGLNPTFSIHHNPSQAPPKK